MKLFRGMVLFTVLMCPLSLWAATLPAPGSVAPEFSLPDQSGRIWRLGDLRGRWVVLYFYPKDDTPGCTEEACQFRDDLVVLKTLGAQDRKSTRLNSSHSDRSRMPSSA